MSKNEKMWHKKESLEYGSLLPSFFTSDVSRNDPWVIDIKDSLLRETRRIINCTLEDDLDVLRVPVIMFYCTDLTLNNLVSTKDCYQSFAEGQRYFCHLKKIKFCYALDFEPESKYGKRIYALIDRLDLLSKTIVKPLTMPQL